MNGDEAIHRGKDQTERISVLESLQRQTTDTIEKWTESVDKLHRSFEKMSEKLSNVGRPQWNTLAAWAGVVIVFIGMVGGSVINGIISNQSRMELLLTRQQDHYMNYLIGHERFSGGLNEKVAALERSVLLLSEIHAKDMDIYRQEHVELKKDMKNDIAKESSLLDIRMQREMNDRISPVGKNLDRLYDLFREYARHE